MTATPNPLLPPGSFLCWRAGWILALIVMAAGCGSRESPYPTVRAPESVEFNVEITARDGDQRLIEVVASASDPNVWRFPFATDSAPPWEDILSVRLIESGAGKSRRDTEPRVFPPLLADYVVEANALRLRPRYPLVEGQLYEIRFEPAALPGFLAERPAPLVRQYRVHPRALASVPVLEAIYPSASELSANHLKFYLLFSEPMQQGEIFEHFELLDEAGEAVPEPFRETELWSDDGRRLTLWFHPGRQKTGVNLNVEIGPILEPGRHYALVISGDWPSQRGVPLGRMIRKDFLATSPDRSPPRLSDWQLALPPPGSRQALTVQFPEPLDWALLKTRLWIESADGARLAGRITIGREEMSWSFEPEQDWESGDYRLAVESVLEDLAGNSLARPFEVDVTAPAPPSVPPVLYQEFSL